MMMTKFWGWSNKNTLTIADTWAVTKIHLNNCRHMGSLFLRSMKRPEGNTQCSKDTYANKEAVPGRVT